MSTRRRWFLRLVAITVIAAMGSGSLASQAMWQCLDGHPCPPGCLMTHGQAAAHSGRDCCKAKPTRSPSAHCALCTPAPTLKRAVSSQSCTSPQCVLRLKAKPDVAAACTPHFTFEVPAAILPAVAEVPTLEVNALKVAVGPRAPPGIEPAPHNPSRAPPASL